MLKYVTIFFTLLLAFLDYKAYRRIKRSGTSSILCNIILLLLVLLNLIPLFAPLFMVIMDETNSQDVMKVTSLLFTLFTLFAATRIVFYLFWLPSKIKLLRYVAIIISSLVFIYFSKGILITRTDYTIKEIDLRFKNIPSSFDGFRIAFLSDIHLGSMLDKEHELGRVVEKVKGTGADVIFLGGDLINLHHSELDSCALNILSGMNENVPVIAVLGNHDTGTYLPDSTGKRDKIDTYELENNISSLGWVLLKDSTVFIHEKQDSIAVTGIDYSSILLKHKHSFGVPENFNPNIIYSGIDNGVFNITLSHLPQLWSILCDNGYSDLTLSGHIHAFQFNINLFGKSFSPAQYLYKEWSGLYENEYGKLYITDGIGTVGFMARFGAVPEITVINLRKE